MVKAVSKINRFRPVGHRKGKWKGVGGGDYLVGAWARSL